MSDSTPAVEFPDPPEPESSSGGPGKTGLGKTGLGKTGLGKTGLGKKVAVGAGAVVLAGVVGGGAYAYNQLSGGGAQPADVLPANSDFYARIDLDPSASQKIELFKLINKIPEVGEELGIEDADTADIRERIFDEIVVDACPDVDYEKDVEPWLGDRLGVGGTVEDEKIIIAVQVEDEAAAKKGIASLFDCAGDDYGIAFYEGYALITPTQKEADAARDEAKKETLASTDAFSDQMDALGEQGIASVWANTPELVDSLGEIADLDEMLPEAERDQLAKAGPVALALRADGSAVELAGISDEQDALKSSSSAMSNLPDDTIFGATFAGGGEQVGKQWDAIMEQFSMFEDLTSDPLTDPVTVPEPALDEEFLNDLDPETREIYEDMLQNDPDLFGDEPSTPATPQDFIDEFEAETGLTLPDDLETLLGDSFTISIGGNNLENIPTLEGPSDIEELDIAIRTEGDGALEIMQKLADFADQNGVPLIAEESDGGAVLATSSDSAKGLVEGGGLGDQDRFKAAMPYGDDSAYGFYVDVQSIFDKLLAADPPEDDREEIEKFDVFESAGLSAGNVDGWGRFSLRVSFAD